MNTSHRPPAPTDPAYSDAAASGPSWSPRLMVSLAAIVLVLEMLTISYLMISMALPDITGHFKTDQGAWLLTAFLLVGAMTAPLLGKLADLHGKRKVLLGCIALAAAGFVVSAVSSSYAIMIVGRGLSGVLVPCMFLSYSLIRDVFPARTVPLAVSIATSGMGLIAIPAPFITGWLIDDFGFRSIFWFLGIGLVILGSLIAATTEESTVRMPARLDVVGAALLGIGVAGIMVAISFSHSWGWTSARTLTLLLGGIALVVAWLATAGKIAEPLIDLRVLKRRAVLFTALAAGFIYGVSALYTILLPMLTMTPDSMKLGYGFGLDAEGFAVFQLPLGSMTVLGGLIVGVLVGRNIAPRITMAAGMVAAGLGAALTSFAITEKPLLLAFGAVVGVGLGLGFASIPNLLIEAVPPQLQATTASIVGVFQSVFPAIFPVLVFAVLNTAYAAPIPLSMTKGVQFYTDTGYQVAFLLVAVVAALGLCAALALPRRIVQAEVPDTMVESVPSAPAAIPAHG